MTRYRKTGVRVGLTAVLGLFSLPALIFGLYLLGCWFRIHTGDVYYVEYPYMPAALVSIGLGALCVLFTLYGTWRRSFYGLVFCFPLAFGVASIILIPDLYPHVKRSGIADENFLSSVNSFLRVWYETNHRFPTNESEFKEALARGPAAWQYRVHTPPEDSFYFRSGTRLPYQIVVVADATGPRMNDVSDRPGVIYYCVSSDGQEFWATMTALQHDVAHTASLRRVLDDPGAKVLVVQAAGKDYPVPKY